MNRAMADNLKKARALKGWTQEAAAIRLNLKRSTYQAYEEGRACPPAYDLVTLARTFGVMDLIAFLTDPDYSPSQSQPQKEIIKDGIKLQEHYLFAPMRDKLMVNIILGLVDLE